MEHDIRTLALRWFNEGWNQRNIEVVDELLAENAVGYLEGGVVAGPAEFKAARAMLLEAFPDLHLEVQGTVVEGNDVVIRWQATGTHRGSSLGFRATNHPVTFSGMTWQQYSEGKIVGGCDVWNQGAVFGSLRELAQKEPE